MSPTPGTASAPWFPFTTIVGNRDLDTWVPGNGRTTPNVPAFLDNNADFNIADFTPNGGALGVSAAIDTAATQAAIAEAEACVVSGNVTGARVITPPRREILLNDLIPPIGPGIAIEGEESRAGRFKSNYPGIIFDFGLNDALQYGNAIRNLSINMTDPLGQAIRARSTSNFDLFCLYIEGVLNSTTEGIILDGGDHATQLTTLYNVFCNHVHKGLRLISTGASYCTTLTAIGFTAVCDVSLSNGAGSRGIEITAPSGQGSMFINADLEACEHGIDCSGNRILFSGTRFEPGNTVDVILNAGATYIKVKDSFSLNNATDNSGSATNVWLDNFNDTGVVTPANSARTFAALTSASTVTFGADSSYLQQGNTGVIANDGTATIAISGHAFELVVTDTASNSIATFYISPSASTTTALGTTTLASAWSITQGTASKVNVTYVGGGVITIENKTGGNNTVYYNLRRIRS